MLRMRVYVQAKRAPPRASAAPARVRSASSSRATEGPAKRQPETKNVPKTRNEVVPKTVEDRDVPKKSPESAKMLQTKKMRTDKCCAKIGDFDLFG